MSAQRIARRKISAEKLVSAAKTSNNPLDEELAINDYETKMKSIDLRNCMDRVDGNLSPASIRRRNTRSKSVQNSDVMSRDESMTLIRQVRSASDGHFSFDVMHRRLGLSSVTSDETLDESDEINDHVMPGSSQVEDLISPRSWSDMIANDTAIEKENKHQHNVNNNNHKSKHFPETERMGGHGVAKGIYVEDVTFHDVNSNQPIRSIEAKDDLITPRTWGEMVAEDSASRDKNHESSQSAPDQGSQQNLPPKEASDQLDFLASSIEFAWPKDLPCNGSLLRDCDTPETEGEDDQPEASWEKGNGLARLEWNLRMLKRNLLAMRKTDQKIFRQLLGIYETIGHLSDHVTFTSETPSPLPPSPSPCLLSPRSTPSSPEKSRSFSSITPMTTPGDTELLRIIREALDQPGALNIRHIFEQLSPIRRRRSSEPTPVEYEDLPPGFGEEGDEELEDLLSLSCPVFK